MNYSSSKKTIVPPTQFNLKQQQNSKLLKVQEIQHNVNKLSATILQQLENGNLKMTPITLMNLIEQTVSAHGGETKLQFLDVSHSFVKAFVRAPLEANLFPFMENSEDNPRFHKAITQFLIKIPCIKSIRWIPSIGENRGSYILVEI